MRKSVMAGFVAAGAIGAALAAGGVAYAAGGPDTGNSERIVRIVEEAGTTGYTGTGGDCPDKGGSTGESPGESGSSGASPSESASGTGGDL